MAFVHNHSDRVGRTKLCSKPDMDILSARVDISEFIADKKKKIAEYINQIKIEQQRKYPCAEYIASRERSIAKINAIIAGYSEQIRK